MGAVRLTNCLAAALLSLLVSAPFSLAPAEEPSLGEKVKQFFASPTPTPTHRRHKHKESTGSPSPSATPSSKRKKGKRKTKPTPSPSPTESPTPSSDEAASPTPTTPPTSSPRARVATISPNEIEDYDKNSEPVRKLLDDALALTKSNLDYTYGSADPEKGGMDCSGFIYYVLRQNGVEDVPRDSSSQYVWVRKAGNFRAVLSRNTDSFEFDELEPGDLLFWTGTYGVERDPPVTHTMIYLGKEKDSGKPIMVGAIDGRTYQGEKQFGVSVFDFKTPPVREASASGKTPRFVGYAKVPGLGKKKP